MVFVKNSLKSSILIPTLLVIFLSFLVMSNIFRNLIKNHLDKDIIFQAKALSSNIKSIIKNNNIDFSKSQVDFSFLDLYYNKHYKSFYSVIKEDEFWKIIYSNNQNLIGKYLKDIKDSSEYKDLANRIFSNKQKDIYIKNTQDSLLHFASYFYIEKSYYLHKEVVNLVDIDASYYSIFSKKMLNIYILIIVQFLVVGILIYYILCNRIFIPISNITEGIKKHVIGKNEVIPIIHNDEIGETSIILNEMFKIEKYYQNLYQKTPLMLHFTNEEGVILEASDYWFEILGYTREEVIGKQAFDFLTEDSKKYYIEKITPEFLEKGFCKNVHYQVLKKDNEVLDILFSSVVEYKNNKEIFSIIGVSIDITEKVKSERIIKEQNAKLQLIFDNVPVMMWYKDQNNNVLYANKKSSDTIGVSAKDLQGQKMDSFVNKEVFQESSKKDLEVIASNKVLINDIEKSFFKNENIKWLKTDRVPYVDLTTNTKSLLVVSIDITAQKLAEDALKESKHRFEFAIKAINYGIFEIYDVSKNDFYCSDCFQRLLGYEPEEVNFNISIFLEIIHPDFQEKIRDFIKNNSKNKFSIDCLIKNKFDQYIWFQLRAIKVNNNRKQSIVGFVNNIHKKKKAEDVMKETLKHLKRSNFEKKKARNDAIDAIENFKLSKSHIFDFIDIVSKDLKYPTRSISNIAKIVLQDNKELENENIDYIKNILGLSQRIEKIIDSSSDYSKLVNTKLDISEVNLNNVLKNVIKKLSKILDNNVDINIEKKLPIIKGELFNIERVFEHLITNSVVHNSKKTKSIFIGSKKENNNLVFYIKDNGDGIKDSYKDIIFDLFKNIKTSDKEGFYRGFGLAFVKEAVKRHNGKIWFDSELGKGTSFYFTLQ